MQLGEDCGNLEYPKKALNEFAGIYCAVFTVRCLSFVPTYLSLLGLEIKKYFLEKRF